MSTAVVDVPPPDEEEIQLAKFVFGDTSDFHKNLHNFDLNDSDLESDHFEYDNGSDDESDKDANNLNQLNDDQLFFVDDGEDQKDNSADENADKMDIDEDSSSEYSSEYDSDESDAWIDSDDEKLHISLMNTNKTKKLRDSYQEHAINGKKYIQRLRNQFEKIYARPKWADDESSDDENDNDNNSSDENDGDDFEKVTDGDINALTKILKATYDYKDTTKSKLLPVNTLDIVRLKDANITHPSHSAIQSLSFHPLKPLLLTGGYDKTLRIYHIDGKNNHLVTSLHLKNTPIQNCSFYVSPKSNIMEQQEQKIFTGGRRRYMHSWDLNHNNSGNNTAKIDKISRLYGHEATQRSFEKFKLGHYYNDLTKEIHGIICLQGNNGWINILNSINGMWMFGCKIEGLLVDFCLDYKPISKDKFQTILIVTNTYGEIWEFDLNNSGKIIQKWKDDAGVGVTTIQVGGGTNSNHLLSTERIRSNRWLAIGSESGFVNVYERSNGSNKTNNSKSIFTLDQITTTISSLVFSPDGQMLCMASRALKDALRLVHLPTGTVFKNWPTSGTPFGKVTSVAFSSHGEMLAVGNEQGKVRLWRLNHY